MAAQDECPVCLLPMKVRVVCPGVMCGYVTCGACFRRFLLSPTNSAILPPHCMKCKREFTRAELVELTNPTFVAKTLTDFRKSQMLSLQKSLLPTAQQELEALWGPDVPGTEEELAKQLQESKARMSRLRHKMEKLRAMEEGETLKHEQVEWAISRCKGSYTVEFLQNRARWSERGKKKTEERRQFIWKCPVEDCRGFLSQQWKCGLCGTYTCNLCGEIKKEGHTCNKDMAESMKLLKSETRHCPSCGVAIFKIAGCDQMWCTNCRTPFSWTTGKVVEDTHIHNPHYVQWLKNNPGVNVRDAGDVGCGGIPDFGIYARQPPLLQKEDYDYVLEFQGRLNHYQGVEVPRLGHTSDGKQQVLRLRFLNKELDEQEWMKELMKCAKRDDYNRNILQVVNMLLNAGSDLLRNLVELRKQLDQHIVRTLNPAAAVAVFLGTRAEGEGAVSKADRARIKARIEDDAAKNVAAIRSLVAYTDEQLWSLGRAYGYRARHSVFAVSTAAPPTPPTPPTPAKEGAKEAVVVQGSS